MLVLTLKTPLVKMIIFELFLGCKATIHQLTTMLAISKKCSISTSLPPC